MNAELSQELLTFIKNSPSPFHTVDSIASCLAAENFRELQEKDAWNIQPEGKYFVRRNGTSIIAFAVGKKPGDCGFKVVASHSDYPTFKIKEKSELGVRGKYIQLNTEGYGSMLCSTWFDRPLSVAGRVIVKNSGRLESRLVNIDRDVLIIPSVAIHMNRQANDGVAYNKQVDLLPLFGGGQTASGDFDAMLARELGVEANDICGKDLYLYARCAGSAWGEKGEFISAPHLDDTECVFTALKGFLQGSDSEAINVYACFDNEEVGSLTKQGAASTFIRDVLHRISLSIGGDEESFYRAVSRSFMVSADNAHAVHPNHPEKTDAENCVYMNEGVVIKSHAGQKYTSDAVSAAVFKEICRLADVPVQFFANRSDAPGGSTLGNIAMAQVSMNCVDIGLAQLAMHSAYETAGSEDVDYMVRALRAFYSHPIRTENGRISVI